MPVDPYGRDNPLGPRATLTAYNHMLTTIETGRADALLVATQQQLDLTNIDAGLAVTVAAHQRDLKRQAYAFGELVEPDYIGLVAALENLLGLLDAVDDAYRQPVTDPSTQWDQVTQMLAAIADSAGETVAAVDTTVEHLDGVNDEITRVSSKLDAALAIARTALDAEADKALARVEELTKKIFDNIQAIVDGAQETGDAVTDLGIGVLTTIAEHSKPDDGKKKGDDPDKPGPKVPPSQDRHGDNTGKEPERDEEAKTDEIPPLDSLHAEGTAQEKAAETKNTDGGVPDVTFVVSAIKAGSTGTEKYAAAVKDLQSNNDRLAAAYQKVAATDRLIAVASAAQAQKNLYAAAMREAHTAAVAIRDDWAAIREGYLAAPAADRDEFARLYHGAMVQWNKLEPELARIRRHLVNVQAPKLV